MSPRGKIDEGSEFDDDSEVNLEEEDEYEKENKKRFPFLRNIMTIYDKKTLLMIGLTFFNEGAEFMLVLAVTKQFIEWDVSPAIVSLHIALLNLPQGLSFFFGFLSDITDVLGYRKRFYISLAALI